MTTTIRTPSMARRKIAFLTTANFTARSFLYPHIRELSQIYDVTIISDGDAAYFEDIISESVHFCFVDIRRKIEVYSDFKTLLSLYRLFKFIANK